MVTAFFFLIFAPFAHSNMWDGRAVLPHCQQLNIAVPEAAAPKFLPTTSR